MICLTKTIKFIIFLQLFWLLPGVTFADGNISIWIFCNKGASGHQFFCIAQAIFMVYFGWHSTHFDAEKIPRKSPSQPWNLQLNNAFAQWLDFDRHFRFFQFWWGSGWDDKKNLQDVHHWFDQTASSVSEKRPPHRLNLFYFLIKNDFNVSVVAILQQTVCTRSL